MGDRKSAKKWSCGRYSYYKQQLKIFKMNVAEEGPRKSVCVNHNKIKKTLIRREISFNERKFSIRRKN